MRKNDLDKLNQIKAELQKQTESPNIVQKIDEFSSSVEGVTPIKQDKVTVSISNKKSDKEYRRIAAIKKPIRHENFLTEFEVEPVEPEEIISHKSTGLQPGVFKKLRQGEYGFDFKLDLHRKTVAEARNEVWRLLKHAESNGYRTLLITHGKGAMSNPPARIKSFVRHWLLQVDTVIAFHSAIARHGGSGATWVLLKKPAAPNRLNEVKYL